MPKLVPALMGLFVCSGCVQAPVAGPVISQVESHVTQDGSHCQNYTASALIDGQPRQITGRACQQPDGSWQVSETATGQTTQYVIYWPPAYAAYPYDDAWLWGPPLGFSVGAFFFIDRDHHVHRFDHFHRFAFARMHPAGVPHFAFRGTQHAMQPAGMGGHHL